MICNKFVKKVSVCVLSGILLFTTPVGVSAADYSKDSVTTHIYTKTVDLKGKKQHSKKNATTYMKGILYWKTGTKARYEGNTGGSYAGDKKADKIIQYDSISAVGIGSLSVSDSASATIDGGTATYKYSAKNKKSIANNVSYTASRGVTITVTVTTATKYTWGNSNVRVECGNGY